MNMICIKTASVRKYKGKWSCFESISSSLYHLILDATIMVYHFHMDYEQSTYFIKLKQQNTKYDGKRLSIETAYRFDGTLPLVIIYIS